MQSLCRIIHITQHRIAKAEKLARLEQGDGEKKKKKGRLQSKRVERNISEGND